MIVGQLVLGDSFCLLQNDLVNLTYLTNYFDFYESRSGPKETFEKMKELKAKPLLGERIFPVEKKKTESSE